MSAVTSRNNIQRFKCQWTLKIDAYWSVRSGIGIQTGLHIPFLAITSIIVSFTARIKNKANNKIIFKNYGAKLKNKVGKEKDKLQKCHKRTPNFCIPENHSINVLLSRQLVFLSQVTVALKCNLSANFVITTLSHDIICLLKVRFHLIDSWYSCLGICITRGRKPQGLIITR